jgi:hypothetical protein
MPGSRVLHVAIALVLGLMVSQRVEAGAAPDPKPNTKAPPHNKAQHQPKIPNLDCRPCGAPDECQLEPAVAEKLRAEKRAIMLREYPARIVDKLVAMQPPCARCVWGPDANTVTAGVHVLSVEEPKKKWISLNWTREEELIARKSLEKQGLPFYFVHMDEACTCCMKAPGNKWVRQTEPHKRADWDAFLGINKDAAIKFEKKSDLGPEPAELKNAANRDAFR